MLKSNRELIHFIEDKALYTTRHCLLLNIFSLIHLKSLSTDIIIHVTKDVGYQTKETGEGFNFFAPTFLPMTGAGVQIQDLKIAGENVSPLVDNLQILDAGGATTSMLVWDDGSFIGEGWVDMDSMELATGVILPGQSILIDTASAGVSITFAGTVGTEDLVVTSHSGFNFIGNATPVDVKVQDITISGSDVTPLVDNLQILDKGGATSTMLVWDDGSFVGEGWVDMDSMELSDISISAGDGVLVDTANSGVKITIPAAL